MLSKLTWKSLKRLDICRPARCSGMKLGRILLLGVFLLAVRATCFGAAGFPVCDFSGIGKFQAVEGATGTLTTENATAGKKAFKLESGGKGWAAVLVTDFPKDWSGVKYLVVDVYNPGKKAVELAGWVKDDPTGGLYSRYNYRGLIAEPGKNTLRLWLAKAVKGNAFPLNQKNIQAFCMGPFEGQPASVLYFDNFRIEPGTEEKLPVAMPILDFEEGSTAGKYEIEDWPEDKPGKSKMELSAEHVTQGKNSLKCSFRPDQGNLQVYGFFQDWSQYDYLTFDCYNDTGETIELSGWFRDYATASYMNRYNYSGLMLLPGQNVVRFPLSGFLKGEAAMSGPGREALNRANIVRFNLGVPPRKTETVLYFDNFRLDKSPLPQFAGERIRKFQFCRTPSSAFPGFTPVNNYTAYDPAYGYGWKGKTASDPQCGNYEYPSDLFGSFIPGHEFVAELPNGKYHVVVYAETACYWEFPPNHGDRKIIANGKLALEDRWTEERYDKELLYRNYLTEDLPGDDHWDKYVTPRWVPLAFDVEVTDKRLSLQFDDPKNFDNFPSGNQWPLNCMLIFPAEDLAKGEAWLKELNAEQKRIFALKYHELPPPIPPRPAQLPAELTASDYAVFVPDYFKDIYPASVPSKEELDVKEISLKTPIGEYASAAIGIFPNKDLGKTTVTVSQLKRQDGKMLADGAATAHRVRYKIKRRETGTRFVYSVIPRLLDDENWAEVSKGVTRTFQVVIKVPAADDMAGVYSGTVTITPEKGKPASIPVKLEVLPFKLVDDRDFDHALFGLGAGDTLMNLKNLREHGMTTSGGPGYATYSGGKLNMEGVEKFVKLYHDAGFDGNMFVAYGSGGIHGVKERAQIVDAYTQYCKRLAELGRTKLMLSLADEPSKSAEAGVHEYYKTTIERLKLYQGIPGLMTSGYYSDIEELIPYFEVSIGGGLKEEFIKKVKAAGKLCWSYGTPTTRFGYGFYAAKAKELGVGGCIGWIYQVEQGDPYNSLDGREEDHDMAFPAPGGKVINDILFDRIREGVCDYRHMTTLRKLIAAKKDSPAAAEGQKLIDEILASMVPGNSGGFKGLDAEASRAKAHEYRTKLSDAILKLSK